MSQKSILITGANRGIGLEFCKQFAQAGWQIIACSRHPQAPELVELAHAHNAVQVVELDLNDLQACEKTLTQLEMSSIDIVINNAGTSGQSDQSLLTHYDVDNAHQLFQVNSIAPVKVVEYLLPKLKQGETKTIVNITSRMGSIEDNDSGKSYAYRSSKAALNALMKSVQIDLADQGFKVLLLHPGWVQTDMGGKHAQITPEESVKGMMKLILSAHDLPEIFYHYQGHVLPF